MTAARDPAYLVSLVHELRRLPAETEWVEFKRNRCEPSEIGEYLSALSNGAALAGKAFAYVLWGIDDTSHEVVGTTFERGTRYALRKIAVAATHSSSNCVPATPPARTGGNVSATLLRTVCSCSLGQITRALYEVARSARSTAGACRMPNWVLRSASTPRLDTRERGRRAQ